jgi:hypothetical protein
MRITLSWVSGPTSLTGSRSFNVTVGTHTVLLVNGKPRETVYAAGRNGGIINLFGDRRVPQFGDLQIMVFRSAVDVTRLASADVRLADGATITVSADLEVKPAWEANDSLLLKWVERYGANAGTIEHAAEAALDADFAAIVTSSLGQLTHDQVHSIADKRSLLKSAGCPTGLLAIDKILNVTCSEDRHARAAHDTRRELIVAQAEAEADEVRFRLGQELDALRAMHANRIGAIHTQGELALERARAHNTAIINAAVAALYGLNPVDVAYPEVHADRQRILAETVRSVLTENADMLPLLAELGESSPAGFLQQMFSAATGPAPTARRPGAATTTTRPARPVLTALPLGTDPGGSGQRWPSAPEVASQLTAIGIHDPVVGSAVCEGPQGLQRIALTASGSDRVVGSIGVPGTTNAIVVRERATVFETVNRVLVAAAQWCGYTLGYKPVNGSGGRLLIDIDQVSANRQHAHHNAPLALAAWVSAINALMANTIPQVTVSVLGQR